MDWGKLLPEKGKRISKTEAATFGSEAIKLAVNSLHKAAIRFLPIAAIKMK